MAGKGALQSAWGLLRLSWDKKYFGLVLLNFVLSIAAALAVGWIFFQLADAWMKVSGASFSGILVTLLIFFLSLVAGIFADAFFQGNYFFLARQKLEGKPDFGKSVSLSQKRFLSAGAQKLLVQLALFAFALVVFAPFLYGVWPLLGSSAFWNAWVQSSAGGAPNSVVTSFLSEAVAENAAAFAGGMLVFFLALSVLLPFFLLAGQTIFFEPVSVLESVKRAWNRSRKNWGMLWKSFLAFLLVSLPVLILTALLSGLPDLYSAPPGTASTVVAGLLSVPYFLALAFWFSFAQLWLVSLYKETAKK